MSILQWIRSILFIIQATVMLPVIGILYAPWAMVSKRGAYAGCRAYARWVIWTAGWLINLRCEVRGTPPDMASMVAAKHQSFLDILMIYNALPAAKFIMKSQLRWSPFLGQYATKMEMVFVDRGKRGAAITKMLADVEAGSRDPGQLVIYPQGTRSPPVLEPIQPGLPRDAFVAKLENMIETESTALLHETGLAHLYEKD